MGPKGNKEREQDKEGKALKGVNTGWREGYALKEMRGNEVWRGRP